ncbi:hypothetical protein E2R51_02250 [Jeotgalibacillus sp. S-D1]|uniref:hypothetical protein n=1 Tax=Jeotgalibacillus sp. S-D1 TaxID=2552189 RepID=UPI00105957C3|nr:hypothetical protein [Jeotgalibacillus sp. S-D1]TDL34558.1 hypothetical protein E2R51_02250 [Jeotgalibacillus sp. S-D1]
MLIKTLNENSLKAANEQVMFFKAYRVFINPSSKHHLTPDEFYIYSLLNRYICMDRSITITRSMLEQVMPFPLLTKKADNRKRITETLEGLINKDVLTSHLVRPSKSGINELMQFSINDLILSDLKENDKKISQRYLEFPLFIVFHEKIKSSSDLYICYVVRSKVDNGKFPPKRMSGTYWAKVLGKSTTNASYVQKMIDSCVERQIIFKRSGVRKEDSTQEYNLYDIQEIDENYKEPLKQKNVIEELPVIHTKVEAKLDEIPF